MLTVTNGNDFGFSGRYNGTDYNFPSKKTTAIPDDAAKHIFGVGLPDKTEILVRHGWMTTNTQFDTAMAILNKFSFNVADQLQAGEIIETATAIEEPEQGSAPLQTESGGNVTVPDGTEAKSSQSANRKAGSKSILSALDGLN